MKFFAVFRSYAAKKKWRAAKNQGYLLAGLLLLVKPLHAEIIATVPAQQLSFQIEHLVFSEHDIPPAERQHYRIRNLSHADDTQPQPSRQETVHISDQVFFSEQDIASVKPEFDGREFAVDVHLQETAIEPFAQFTRTHLGSRIALMDHSSGLLFSAPIIQTEINGGRLRISGGLTTLQDAEKFAAHLKNHLEIRLLHEHGRLPENFNTVTLASFPLQAAGQIQAWTRPAWRFSQDDAESLMISRRPSTGSMKPLSPDYYEAVIVLKEEAAQRWSRLPETTFYLLDKENRLTGHTIPRVGGKTLYIDLFHFEEEVEHLLWQLKRHP